jgi:hypothetical protein
MDNESTIVIDALGTKLWKNRDGKFHRLDGPAIEYAGGRKHWYENGEKHRLDGPAVICPDGENHWYKHGKRHRLDGPATTYPSGDKYWYVDGLIHREDGPAIIYVDGENQSDGENQWWIYNVRYKTKEEYFNTLSDEAKAKCLFSEDFLNEW